MEINAKIFGNFHLNIFLKLFTVNIMVQKTMVFLCMLIGWSQTYPYHNVPTENNVMKDADKIERERRAVMSSVSVSYICTADSL